MMKTCKLCQAILSSDDDFCDYCSKKIEKYEKKRCIDDAIKGGEYDA